MSPVPAGRGNGLQAGSYLPLADLQPLVADAVLDLLADEGIAAYAAPAGERRPSEIVAERISGVLDRVYVDSTARSRARALLEDRREHLEAGAGGRTRAVPPAATPPPASDADAGRGDDDAVWAELVAAYGETPATRPWPVAEDLPETGAAGTGPPGRVLRAAHLQPADDVPAAGEPPAEEPPADEHFVPPPPPPVPTGDRVSRWAWAALLGTPAFFFVVVLLGVELAGWVILLGVVAFVAGFVTLVVRMGDGSDDRDDGAVV